MRVERDQVILVAAITAVLVGFGVLGYMPIRSGRQESKERIDVYKAQLASDLAGARQLPKLREEVAALQEALGGSQRDVPTQSELASLLRTLSSELDRQQVTDKEVQTRAIQSGADYNVLPVSLRFTGTFGAVYGFVRQIESMPRLIRIDRLELSGTPDGAGRLTARIELSTFFTAGEASGS